jgi:hypothetical protein
MTVNSPQGFARLLNEKLKLGLTRLPWNLYSPTETLWWLVPSSDNPAYRYGKLAFSYAKDDGRRHLLGTNDPRLEPDKMFAGFNLEKGLDKVAMFVDPALKHKPEQMIDPNWTWFSVIVGDGPAAFRNAIAAAAEHSPMYLYVDSSYAHDRQSNIHVQHDTLMFSADGDQLRLIRDNGLPLGVLQEASRASDFVALADWLRRIDGYHWVDLYVGTHVTKGEVKLHQFHLDVVSPFGHWLK